jgi:hypothetical protein
MIAPLEELGKEESAEEITGLDDSEKTVLKQLFEADGTTPKMSQEGLPDLLGGMPQASPFLVSSVQNLSILPARILGNHWIMSEEEASMIAGALIPVLKEMGISVTQLDPKLALAVTIGIYALPKIIVTILSRRGARTPSDQPYQEVSTREHSSGKSEVRPRPKTAFTAKEATEAQYEEFREKYAASLDEEGKDLFPEKRTIQKPRKR